MKRVWLTVPLLVLLSGCTAKKEPGDLTVKNLFDHARDFDGKRVAVIGWYLSDIEESSLFPAPYAIEPLDGTFDRQIWVEPGWRRVTRLTHRYVRVVGIFHFRPEAECRIEKRSDGSEFESVTTRGYGTYGLYPAQLSDISYFRPFSPTHAPNLAMQRTVGRAAASLSMISTFSQQRRAPPPPVDHLGFR
jgi:hypothetical protein